MTTIPCKAEVRQITLEDLQAYYALRVSEWVASGRFPDMEAVVNKCNEELAAFDAGAWEVKCACGWSGNNPYPSKEDAVSSLEAHYEGVRSNG